MWPNRFMFHNFISPFAPGDGIGGIVQESWGVIGELLFIGWTLVLPLTIIISLSKSTVLILKSKINSKDEEGGNKVNYKQIFKESVIYIVVCVLCGVVIFAICPILFKIESSGGKLTGGPYFSGFRSFS